MKIIFIVFILLSILNSLVEGQISASNNNNNIELRESIFNKYSTYGTTNSNYQQCSFYLRFDIIKSINPTPFVPEIVNTVPFGYSILNDSILIVQSSQLGVSDDSYVYYFTIQDKNDISISTDFTLTLGCDVLDGSLLQVSLVSSKPHQLNLNSFFAQYQIKGLKNPLDSVIVTNNKNGQVYSRKDIGDSYYSLYITVAYPKDFINQVIEVGIVFPNKVFNLTLDSIYSNSDYQSINYQTYPATLPTSTYNEYGYYVYPQVVFTTNFTEGTPYYQALGDSRFSLPSRFAQIKIGGILRYYYAMVLVNSLKKPPTTPTYSYKYTLSYNNGPVVDNLDFQVYDFKIYPFPLDFTGELILSSKPSNTFTFSFSSKMYRGSPFFHSLYYYSLYTQFPYGFVSGNNLEYNYASTYIQKSSNVMNLKEKFYMYEHPNRLGSQIPYDNPSNNTNSDMEPPIVEYFELTPIHGFKYLLRVGLSDESLVTGFSIASMEEIFYGYDSLVSIDNGTWFFEASIDAFLLYQQFNVYDIYGNIRKFSADYLVYINKNGIPVYLFAQLPIIDLNIENVTFAENDIDILNKPNYNTIYFNSSTIPNDYPLLFSTGDDVTNSLLGRDEFIMNKGFPVSYDYEKKLFYCDFVVPKNSNPGFIPYVISSLFISRNQLNSPLRVSKTAYDNSGPLISSIVNANTFGKVGWRITVTDTQNGFSSGYIKVVGSLDSSIFKFNFTISDAVLDSGSTVWRGEYDIIVNVNSSRCISQDYIMEYIYLEDSNRLFSYFTKFQQDYPSIKNPLRNHLDNLEYYLKSSSKCLSTIKDSTPPELVSFTPLLNSTGSGSLISFKFVARDLESGLMSTQRPIVYIQEATRLMTLECISTITSINDTHAEYYCELQLPIGFANDVSGGGLLSVYGFINNAGLFSGFNSNDSKIYDSSFIEIKYSFGSYLLLTGSEPYYSNSINNLVLYGRSLGSTSNISIVYSDGTTKWYIPTKKIGESVVIIKRDDYQVIGPFNVTATMDNGNKTNTITIYPIVFISTNSSSESSETSMPSKPQQCIGDPVCGGPSNGYCNQASGCVCYSPWVGKDCSSKVIIIPKPNTNGSTPTTEIPIQDKESQAFYKSLVSIVSLRELSINNSVVHEHSLDRWIYTEINSTVGQYYSSISFKSLTNQLRQFEIYVTLKWYNNETIVEFADQYFSMNPSSMKYAIDIINYQFESRLNRLQLVLHASLFSNKTNGICSSKEFGDTTSGDNSNYIKIQVNSTSLYGRFIKRGIIDDRIVSLSNELLDREMNVISSPSQVQSYIGISIPWFERHSVIDPDFSVLVDSSSASSICAPNNSGLSTLQKVGIIIGCVVFFIAIVTAVTYSIYKSKKKKRFLKNISNKMVELNNIQSINK